MAKGRGRLKLGELLLEAGVITLDNLKKALEQQSWEKKPLGEVLIQMNLITEEKLTETLSWQLKTDTFRLSDQTVNRELITLLPENMPEQKRILPVERKDNKLVLVMADPSDLGTIEDVRFMTGCEIKPLIATPSAIKKAIERIREDRPIDDKWDAKKQTTNFDIYQSTIVFSQDGSAHRLDPTGKVDKAIAETDSVKKTDEIFERLRMSADENTFSQEEIDEVMLQFGRILEFMQKGKATYLHLCVGAAPTLRLNGQFIRMKMEPLSDSYTKIIAQELLDADLKRTLEKTGSIEKTIPFENMGRFGFNFFKQRKSVTISIRALQNFIPSLTDLGFPDFLKKYLFQSRGLVILGGLSGNGKSTTMAAMVDEINHEKSLNIITIEDPIKYLITHKKSNVNQREIGLDAPAIAEALRFISRQDANVVAVDEVRNREDMQSILDCVESGHLVMCTIDADSSISAIEKIFSFFPDSEQGKIQIQLAHCLSLIVAQRLVPRADKTGKVLAFELMEAADQIKTAIRAGDLNKIAQILDSSPTQGLISIERYIKELFQRKIISQETAVRHIHPTHAK